MRLYNIHSEGVFEVQVLINMIYLLKRELNKSKRFEGALFNRYFDEVSFS